MKSQNALALGDDLLGDAVVAHQREREPAVRRDALVVALAVGGDGLERRDRGARAPRDRRGQARVVEVVVRDQHELDVLELEPRRAQARPRARPAPRRSAGRCPRASAGRRAAATR